jgi:hypothetical protein
LTQYLSDKKSLARKAARAVGCLFHFAARNGAKEWVKNGKFFNVRLGCKNALFSSLKREFWGFYFCPWHG